MFNKKLYKSADCADSSLGKFTVNYYLLSLDGKFGIAAEKMGSSPETEDTGAFTENESEALRVLEIVSRFAVSPRVLLYVVDDLLWPSAK
jgi:hypothetical protein